MQTASKSEFVRVEDYLAAEESSEIQHEYLGGLVYAMTGETLIHTQIAGNLYLALRQHLKGKPRHANNWKAEKFSGQKSIAVLKSLKLKPPLSAIHEDV